MNGGGGRASADVNLTAGQVLRILVGGRGFDGGGSGGGTGFINNDVAFSPTNIVTENGVRTGNGLVEITAPTANPIPFAFSPLPGLVVGGVLSRLKRRKQSQQDASSPVKAC